MNPSGPLTNVQRPLFNTIYWLTYSNRWSRFVVACKFDIETSGDGWTDYVGTREEVAKARRRGRFT